MSLLSRLRAALAVPALAAGDVRHLSPYDDVNHLWPIVAPDWLPAHRISRAQAMAVPAVNRARRVLCNRVALSPLRAYRATELAAEQPRWLDRTDGPVSPYHRMLWTIDDLLFYGWSAWAAQRDYAGQVIAADRIPFDRWHIDDQGRVIYRDDDGTESVASAESVILIPGSDEGLLTASPGAIRHAADLLHSAAKAAENPAAYIDLHQTNESPITEEDRQRLIDGWVRARRGENGGVAFSSAGIDVRELGAPIEHLLVEGRNAAALDVARACGVPGQIVDATTPTASLNYENAEAKNRDLIDYGLSAFMAPVSARLGMDDVVPRGISLRFDLESDTGPGASVGAPDDGSQSTPPKAPQLRSVNE